MRAAIIALVVSTGLWNCTGSIVGGSTPGTGAGNGGGGSGTGAGGGGGGTGTGGAGGTWSLSHFTCDATQSPTELPLRRLSRVQFLNTFTSLVTESGLSSGDASTVLGALAPDLATVPPDAVVGLPGEKRGGFTRLDQTIQQAQVDAAYALGTHLGTQLTSSTARITAVVGACATNASTSDDAACLTSFVNRFGRLALRRPVTSAELTFITGVAGSTPVDPLALADVIALMTNLPQFLYHVEEGDPTASAPTPLDAWALANRLSYHFWQTAPDQALRDAADTGALLTPAGYQAQVQRLFADARTEGAVRSFFHEWFRLDELTPLNVAEGTPVFDAFAGVDKPAGDLHQQMQLEVEDAVVSVTRSQGSVASVLTNRKQYARRADLAKLYGAQPWDGVSAPLDLPEPERSGLLTRGAFLSNASGSTRPVMKGLKIRSAMLCQKIPPPPANVNATPPTLQPDLTTREVVEHLTQQPGTACLGCHGPLLNPLGFVTENFDALGRHRTQQTLFAADGTVTMSKPVNTVVVPNVAGVETTITDARDLTQILSTSGEFETCFARQYFRFTFDRIEDDLKDGCALSGLQQSALSGNALADVLMSAALRDEFKRRDLR
jgi:hypothetical protein